MSYEWKPGDVGLNCGNRVFRTDNGWRFVDGDGIVGFDYTVRPLVVIDPEDEDQVDRLGRILDRWGYQFYVTPDHFALGRDGSCLAAALREFANPTPPKCGSSVDLLYSDGKGCTYTCTLAAEHDGMHSCADDFMWGGVA